MIIIFWEMTPCGSYKNRRFGGVSYEFLPIQELTTSLCNQFALVHPEDGGGTILRNVGSYKSHCVISQKMIIIIVTAVETTSLTVSYISTNIGIIVEYMAESLNFY
jgi:hypothetical protein